MTTIRTRLQDAQRNGEVVAIIYNGGSQPGTTREISPISVGDSEVSARDMATGLVKLYKLSKITLRGDSSTAEAYVPGRIAIPVPEVHVSIEVALQGRVSALENLGWRVELESEGVALFRFFKNGKPRKTSDIRLTYSEWIVDQLVDPDSDGFIEERRKSTRPYRLDSPGLPMAKTFSKLSSALEIFFDHATLHAPRNAT